MKFFTSAFFAFGLWIILSLLILAPIIGMAWVLALLTELTLGQTSLLVFGYCAILAYITEIYGFGSNPVRWLLIYVTSAVMLALTTLIGLLLRNVIELPLFQGMLLIGGSELLLAHAFLNAIAGGVPDFLRRPFYEYLSDYPEEAEDDEEDITPSPPPPRKTSRTSGKKRRTRR